MGPEEDVRRGQGSDNAARLEAERWRAAFDSVLDMVAFLSPDGSMLQCNRAFADFVGRDPDALEGEKCYRLVHDAERRVENCPLLRALKSGTRETLEMSVGQRIFLVVTDPIKEPGKEIGEFVHIIRDITEAKRLEQALRDSEEDFRRMTEDARDGIIVAAADGSHLYANRRACEITGYSAEELSKIGMSGLAHPDELPKLSERLARRIAGEEVPDAYETAIVRKDGRIVPVEIAGSRIQWHGQAADAVVVRDITQRKRLEQELRESEDRYRTLVERSLQAVLVIEDFRIVYANKRCEEVTGYTVAELLALPPEKVMELVHPDDRDLVWGRFRERAAGKDVPPNYECRGLRKDGTVRWLEIFAGPIEYRGRRAIQAAVMDITDARKSQEEMASLQEQFRQAQKMEAIGRLAGGVAHDFNNLLTVIKGTCQLSLHDLPESDPMRQSFEEIMEASDRAAALTRQLLAFGRKQVMEVRVIDLNRVLEGLDKMLRRIIGEDIELVTFLQDGIGMVRADPGQIEQAIINIVINARDAMPGGGKLTIETANVYLDEEYVRLHHGVQPGPHVMVSISDTGAGMTPDVKEHIFEPFFSTKEGGKGTGLGLSTVYGIVKQSRGSVWVYSEPGRGTTFKIYLPRVYAPADAVKERPSGEVPRGSETVLVVEDEEGVRKLAVRVLAQQGYKTLEAADGAGALALCGIYKETVDLILTDVVIPGMSGRETAERLRAIHPEAKVLYMSGYTDNVIVHHGVLQEGMKFLHKPFTAEGLARKVREVLDE